MICHHLCEALILSFAFILSEGFSPLASTRPNKIRFGIRESELRSSNHDDAGEGVPASAERRNLLLSTAASSLATLTFVPEYSHADEGGMGSDPEHPIVVIGSNGKCGSLCLQILSSEKNLYARGVTRSGKSAYALPNEKASVAAGDVTDYESIKKAVSGASGVIFAASASKKGGDAAHVDYLGVYNTAKACLECNVKKLVVVSSGAVTRPESVGFKATNLFVGGNIMNYKLAGEYAMRDLYKASSNSPPLAYTVIRPGGLSDGPGNGPTGVQVCQGDILSSEIPRKDVAQVIVASLLKTGGGTDFVTIEVNGSAGETLFGQKTGPAKLSKDLADPPADLVHSADSFEGLLDGLIKDEDMEKRKGIFSDFKGDDIVPIETLA